MPKLVVIDGNAIMHRGYHALPSLTTRKGEPINAVYGLISMLLRVIQDLKPTHVIVAFDRKEPTFRKKEFKDYQAHRPPMEKNLASQFEKAKLTLDAFNIPSYDKAGYEADDVIGTLASQQTKFPGEVVIVTGDRDILQLVDDDKKVNVYLPIKGLSDAKLMKTEDVIQKLGVKPTQIVDYKALVGDQSDNYPGVSGIGPKTAIKLLEKYEDLDNIYKHLEEIEKTTRQKLATGKKSAYLSQKLAKIITNLELKVDFEKAKKWQLDSQKVLNLFSEFGFKTLTRRVKEVGNTIVSENQGNLF